eukprot:scaffold35681_cov45-Phaeocystis_antarctica.AAC.1
MPAKRWDTPFRVRDTGIQGPGLRGGSGSEPGAAVSVRRLHISRGHSRDRDRVRARRTCACVFSSCMTARRCETSSWSCSNLVRGRARARVTLTVARIAVVGEP